MNAGFPALPHEADEPGDGPPFLGTWRRIYIAILIYLAALIAVLAIVSGVFTQ